MSCKKNNKMMPFMWEAIILLVIYFLIIIFLIWTRFRYFLTNIFMIAYIIFESKIFLRLFEIIKDVKNNDIINEFVYVDSIFERKYELLSFRKFYVLRCHKVRAKKFTNEIIFLKSAKKIDIKEKSFIKITYYKNSKIICFITDDK